MADDPVTNAAKELFGFSYLFPYQRLVIANILEAAEAAGIDIHWPSDGPLAENGNDCDSDCSDRENLGRQIVILPTGAGKSLCFQLPAMLTEGPTLVIYPILGLMADQERRLAEKGFSPVTLRGGQSKEERDEIWRKLRAGESKFIIANPEVLLTPPVLSRLKEIGIIHIVIDEAHCVCEWGESFRPSYLEIRKIIEAAASPLVTAFTATAGTAVLDKIEEYIFGGPVCRVIGNPDRKNISYAAKGCILRNLAVRDLVLQNQRPAIVFCSSRQGTENLALYLRIETAERALPWHREIRFYHAGLSREEKKDIENWFLDNKDAVLVATCAYGLGIDKPDIRTVIHRDCPPSVEAYLQESGRAGRDGEPSKALLLWGPDDDRSLSRAKTEADKKRISSLLAYARDTGKCRREALLDLLDYDGERDSPGSSCCDVCDGQSNTRLREEHSLLDFFRRNKRCYSPAEAAKVLAHSVNIFLSEEEAGEAIDYLVKAGKIGRANNLVWGNRLTIINP
jgi:ATP-dependent DNA helicase RecQ